MVPLNVKMHVEYLYKDKWDSDFPLKQEKALHRKIRINPPGSFENNEIIWPKT